MSSPAYRDASGASPFAMDPPFGTDTSADQTCSQRMMSVKVIYTLNDKDQSPCLHRLPQPQPVIVVSLDDGNHLGMVDLRVCVQEVLKASPELLPKLKEYDHAVYAYDYSEEDVPTVGQGKLSAILNQDLPGEEPKQIVGRIMRNPLAVFKKQSAETLEVKLKFVALPSDSPLKKRSQRPQLLDSTAAPNSFANRLQAAYDRPAASSPQYPMTSSPGYMPEDVQSYTQHDSPSSMTPQELDMFLNSPLPSPTTTKPTPSVSQMTTHQPLSRPVSRMSQHAPTPPETNMNDAREDGQFDEGPSRKRARLEQAPRPRITAFGAQPRDAPLRRTASTTASIRNFRPILPGATQGVLGQDNDGTNRAPTPRPQRTRNVGPRRASSMSTLRHESSIDDVTVSSSPPRSPTEDPSPAFTSSPPLRGFDVYDDAQRDDGAFLSSPLQPYDSLDAPSFSLEDFEMTFSELPDIPDSDFDARVDLDLSSAPAHDSGIGMMSEDQEPSLAAKAPAPVQQSVENISHAVPGLPHQVSGQAKSTQVTKPAKKAASARPNQKSQTEFAPGAHPLYQQRTTKIAWNSYSPQGGPALYVQTPQSASLSQSKARNSLKLPQIPKEGTPSNLSRSTSQMSTSSADPAPKAQHRSASQVSSQGTHGQQFALPSQSSQPSQSPTKDGQSPQRFALPPPTQTTNRSARSPTTESNAPTPPAAPGHQAGNGSSPSNRTRAPLGAISGNAVQRPPSRAGTPNPIIAEISNEAQTPGSKTGTKRKRTASKAPTKTVKDTPSGRSEKKAKRGPRPLVDEEGNRIHCYTCGAIESTTWRSLYLKIFTGPDSPARLFDGLEKVAVHPNVDPMGNLLLDADGRVREWVVYRKSLSSQEQQRGEWTVFKQCNACGVHFNQHGQLKVPDWGKLMGTNGPQQQGGYESVDPNLQSMQPQSGSCANAHVDLTMHESDHCSSNDQPQPDKQPRLDSDAADGSEEDKENLPPVRDTDSVFDELCRAGDALAPGSDDFEDLWARGFEEMIWPGEVVEGRNAVVSPS